MTRRLSLGFPMVSLLVASHKTTRIIRGIMQTPFYIKIVKFGGQDAAGAGFKSRMPAFQSVLSNADIWAVLAFIKSRWPPNIRAFHDRVNAPEP